MPPSFSNLVCKMSSLCIGCEEAHGCSAVSLRRPGPCTIARRGSQCAQSAHSSGSGSRRRRPLRHCSGMITSLLPPTVMPTILDQSFMRGCVLGGQRNSGYALIETRISRLCRFSFLPKKLGTVPPDGPAPRENKRHITAHCIAHKRPREIHSHSSSSGVNTQQQQRWPSSPRSRSPWPRPRAPSAASRASLWSAPAPRARW